MKYPLIARPANLDLGFFSDVHYATITNQSPCDQLNPGEWCSVYYAFTSALNDINSRTDLLPNITIGFVAVDDCWEVLTTLAASTYFVPYGSGDGTALTREKSVNESKDESNPYPVIGVVGPLSSDMTSFAAGYLRMFQIPQIGIYATSDYLTDKTRYEYFLRMVSLDSVQVRKCPRPIVSR